MARGYGSAPPGAALWPLRVALPYMGTVAPAVARLATRPVDGPAPMPYDPVQAAPEVSRYLLPLKTMGTHFVYLNGLCASRGMGRDRAMAAARDAVAARPDAHVSVQRIGRDASTMSTGATVAVLATGDNNAATGESCAADAWRVADPAVADVVAFVWIAETVTDAVAETTAAAWRVATTRQTSPAAYETAQRVADVVAERAAQRIRDAVLFATDGVEPDAVPVVVVPSANHAAAGALQRAGVSHVRASGPAERGAAWYASHGGGRAHGFATVADAVNHAAGRSPSLPELRADAAAGRPVSLAAVARAVSR